MIIKLFSLLLNYEVNIYIILINGGFQMKNLLTKILFISLLVSATVPSGVQAGWLDTVRKTAINAWTSSRASLCGNAVKAARFVKTNPRITALTTYWAVIPSLCTAAKIVKCTTDKIKSVSKNKWVRRTVGGGLAATALYAGLARQGYVPGFAQAKTALHCAWKAKDPRAVKNACNSIAAGSLSGSNIASGTEKAKNGATVTGQTVRLAKNVVQGMGDLQGTAQAMQIVNSNIASGCAKAKNGAAVIGKTVRWAKNVVQSMGDLEGTARAIQTANSNGAFSKKIIHYLFGYINFVNVIASRCAKAKNGAAVIGQTVRLAKNVVQGMGDLQGTAKAIQTANSNTVSGLKKAAVVMKRNEKNCRCV